MIAIVMALLGAAWGGYQAKRRNGNTLDILQYAGSYGIGFAILGVFISIILVRMG